MCTEGNLIIRCKNTKLHIIICYFREGGGGGVWIWGLPIEYFAPGPQNCLGGPGLTIYRNYMSFHVKITLTEKPKKTLIG